jgi:hypothetical protein
MNKMTKEITEIREEFRAYILLRDLTMQAAAELVGWKRAGSVCKFLAGKHRPNARRLYRIKRLLNSSLGRKNENGAFSRV